MVTTLQLSGLTSRLSAPARLLATRLGRRGKAADMTDAGPLAGSPNLLERGMLHVPVFDHSPVVAEWADIRASHAALADAERWTELLAALEDADRARSAASGGHRLATLISEAARMALTGALARRDWPAALAEVDRLGAMQAAHPDSRAAAHLLAQAHLDYGWALRCAESGPGIPRQIWPDFLHHTALAEAALGPFDPIEEESPLLAATRYLLVRGIEDGEALCRDWYEDWSDLDPADPAPHLAHAVHLLPPWFGALAAFDAEARQALHRTRHRTGAAAYALFHLAATEVLGGLPTDADVGLFLTGLDDHFRATGCQHRANIVAAALTDLYHSLAGPASDPGLRDAVYAALDRYLRKNIAEFHLSAWENGASCISYAVEQVFAEELARGEHVFAGARGLVARRPA